MDMDENDVLGQLARARDNEASPVGGSFTAPNPPSRDLIDDCVHCGFCLPACPTYNLWGQEMDSPRGRIHLMKQALEGEPIDASMMGHFDACLGCMACVTACPSGVQYDKLITSTRAQIEELKSDSRSRSQRLLRAGVFALFPYRRRLSIVRPLLALYQKLRLDVLVRKSGILERISPSMAMMASVAPRITPYVKLPECIDAVGRPRLVVGMLTGCIQDAFYSNVNAATARVLSMEGCDVIIPPQECCGALSLHSGRAKEGRRFARNLIDAFEKSGVDRIVVNSAGCGSSMKEYAEILEGDDEYREKAEEFAAKVVDISELLDEIGPQATRHPLNITIAYHDACHLSHAQGIRKQPRSVLTGIPGVTLREIEDGDICCGSAGVYNLLNPGPAGDLGDRKATNVAATGAGLLVTSNPGCLLQISAALSRKGESMLTAHTIQVLDASLRGLDGSEFGASLPSDLGARSDSAAGGCQCGGQCGGN